MTDSNGLLYMRARYYSPELRRFINADILMGDINNSTTLNLYAYANRNPISNIDPFGLAADEGRGGSKTLYYGNIWGDNPQPDLWYADENFNQLFEKSSLNILMSENQHLKSWESLIKLVSSGSMTDVLLDMVKHFADGTGTDYTNETLTNNVKYHIATQQYMSDFITVFKTFMTKYNGDYNKFADSKEFKDALLTNKVLLSKYSYGGELFDEDTWSGLTMAIHSWTENQVEISNFYRLGDKYFGTLQFTFKDNFGLDAKDIEEFGLISGFQSWYTLQHNKNYNGKYKPFKTVVSIEYQFSGLI